MTLANSWQLLSYTVNFFFFFFFGCLFNPPYSRRRPIDSAADYPHVTYYLFIIHEGAAILCVVTECQQLRLVIRREPRRVDYN